MHGGKLWETHPGVRTGGQLSPGERAADHLKSAFGSWAFLIILNAFIVAWCVLNATGMLRFDPYPFIALNLVLSWLAAQQGGALQIAANRGDRISAEVAADTRTNTDALLEQAGQILQINRTQSAILAELRALQDDKRNEGETPP